jgi:hypothetical protein
MKRFEFICKGKRSHTIEATTEELARAQFAENRYTSTLEIIDVIEVEIPAPLDTSSVNTSLEGFTQTFSDAIPTSAELASLAASSTKVGY